MFETDEKIVQLFNAEVEARTKEINNNYKKLQDSYSTVLGDLRQTRDDLKKLEYVNTQLSLIEQIKNSVSLEKNFLDFLKIINIQDSGYEIEDHSSDKIPMWFKAIFEYYPEKDKVFLLMDLFNIEYPEYAKKFKMPYDYGEEEIMYILNNLNKVSNTNGNNYSHNIRYFYDSFKESRGDLRYENRWSSYFALPWQLFLKNPLLIEDKYFEKIIKLMEINKDKRTNLIRFFNIQKYQKLPKEKALEMFEFLPSKDFQEEHNSFILGNAEIIKEIPTLARSFADKITTSTYSPFYFVNYPLHYQKDFILRQTDLSSQIKLVDKMDISSEEKVKLVTELATLSYDAIPQEELFRPKSSF